MLSLGFLVKIKYWVSVLCVSFLRIFVFCLNRLMIMGFWVKLVRSILMVMGFLFFMFWVW